MVEYKYDKNKLIINQKQYGKLSTGWNETITLIKVVGYKN
jgi:hypothetical protein